jgi:hypothetical protein
MPEEISSYSYDEDLARYKKEQAEKKRQATRRELAGRDRFSSRDRRYASRLNAGFNTIRGDFSDEG